MKFAVQNKITTPDTPLSLSAITFVKTIRKNNGKKHKKMNTETLDTFTVIGIEVRTTNENGQAATDIGQLWNKFMTEGIMDQIPNKIDSSIYSIYTDYESDHTKPYTTILGCKVKNTDTIPEGMVAKIFEKQNYTKFISKGDLTQGVVYQEWVKIWNADLDRTYTADFEVYGEKAQNPKDAEVEIFVGIK